MTQQTQVNEDAEVREQAIASQRAMLEDKITRLIQYLSKLNNSDLYFQPENEYEDDFDEGISFDKLDIGYYDTYDLTPFCVNFLECPSNRLVYENEEPTTGFVLAKIYLSEAVMELFKEFSGFQGTDDDFEINGIVELDISEFDGYRATCWLAEDFVSFSFDDKTHKILCESYEVLNSKLDRYMGWVDYLKEQISDLIFVRPYEEVVYESYDVFYHVDVSKKFDDDRVLHLCMLAGSLAPALRLIENLDSEG